MDSIKTHREYLEQTGDLARRERSRLASELEVLIEMALVSKWRDSLQDGAYTAVLDQLATRKLSPQEAVQKLVSLEVS